MKMWEIREGYDREDSGYRMGRRDHDELKEAYECGFEEGYEKAMEEIGYRSDYRSNYRSSYRMGERRGR